MYTLKAKVTEIDTGVAYNHSFIVYNSLSFHLVLSISFACIKAYIKLYATIIH